ncbi:MAG: hypothetical protein ABR603_02080, partial [Pyrinomonadaceae bacterium]
MSVEEYGKNEAGRAARAGSGVASPFNAALARALARRGLSFECFCPAGDTLTRRVLEEYGAMFVAEGVRL